MGVLRIQGHLRTKGSFPTFSGFSRRRSGLAEIGEQGRKPARSTKSHCSSCEIMGGPGPCFCLSRAFGKVFRVDIFLGKSCLSSASKRDVPGNTRLGPCASSFCHTPSAHFRETHFLPKFLGRVTFLLRRQEGTLGAQGT